jgi:hypothetical protein
VLTKPSVSLILILVPTLCIFNSGEELVKEREFSNLGSTIAFQAMPMSSGFEFYESTVVGTVDLYTNLVGTHDPDLLRSEQSNKEFGFVYKPMDIEVRLMQWMLLVKFRLPTSRKIKHMR